MTCMKTLATALGITVALALGGLSSVAQPGARFQDQGIREDFGYSTLGRSYYRYGGYRYGAYGYGRYRGYAAYWRPRAYAYRPYAYRYGYRRWWW
jgi:hypothetical protein